MSAKVLNKIVMRLHGMDWQITNLTELQETKQFDPIKTVDRLMTGFGLYRDNSETQTKR